MKKRRVALVLAGGGARGVAHIGAIEELERQGFEISAVAGTSMGALVGGVYASGYLEPFKEWMRALDKYKVFSLVDFALSTEGLVKGDRVMEAMKELVPDVQIERMPVPFAAVAADLLTGDEVVLDGGTVNPLPLNRVRREEGDLLVAVDVSARFGADSVRRANASLNYYKVLIASSQIMQQRITQLMCRLYKPDIMVGLPADSYGMFEFYRSEEILEAGRAATRAVLERLETDGENGMVFAESEEKIATARF